MNPEYEIVCISPQTRIHAVGCQPIVVRCEDLDERQYWLPFVSAVLVLPRDALPEDRKEKRKPPSGATLTLLWKREPLFPTPETQDLYHHEAGVHQRALPFPGPEYRLVHHDESKELVEKGWPGFERDERGELYTLRIAETSESTSVGEFIIHELSWNSHGRFYPQHDYARSRWTVIFEDRRDVEMLRNFAKATGSQII